MADISSAIRTVTSPASPVVHQPPANIRVSTVRTSSDVLRSVAREQPLGDGQNPLPAILALAKSVAYGLGPDTDDTELLRSTNLVNTQ